MALIEKLAPLILKFEGGYANLEHDSGGCTNLGITLATWRAFGYDKNGDGVIDCKDVKLIDKNDFQKILKTQFWDKWNANSIKSQGVANIVVDWLYNSGRYGIIIPQRLLGLQEDGIVGVKTINAINTQDSIVFFNKVKDARIKFVTNIILHDPSQKIFLKGWLNRINSISYE